MSFISRRSESASPPPRSPSPDVVLAPLPPPRRSPRRPNRLSLEGPSERPRPEKPLLSMRSCTELRPKASNRSSRSIVSAPPTPRSIAPSSPGRRTHKRTLSFAAPFRSPPPSPTLASPPPPVPPIPEFVLTPTDKKPVLHPAAPTRVAHIYIPEWEQFTVVPDVAGTPRKPRHSLPGRRTGGVRAPAPMTCSGYLALHSSPTPTSNNVVAP